jgi:hypothetical protein
VYKGVDQHGNRCASADTAGSGSNVAATCKKQKPKQKKELVVEFVTETNSDAFTVEKKLQVLQLTKRTTHKVWNAVRNTHPSDVHFSCKDFSQ